MILAASNVFFTLKQVILGPSKAPFTHMLVIVSTSSALCEWLLSGWQINFLLSFWGSASWQFCEYLLKATNNTKGHVPFTHVLVILRQQCTVRVIVLSLTEYFLASFLFDCFLTIPCECFLNVTNNMQWNVKYADYSLHYAMLKHFGNHDTKCCLTL